MANGETFERKTHKAIEFINDESGPFRDTDEKRFSRVRAWVAKQILDHNNDNTKGAVK